jgi:hypothetical protein
MIPKANTQFAMEIADIPSTQTSSHAEITNGDIAHHFFQSSLQGQVVNEAYHMEMLKRPRKGMGRETVANWPKYLILRHENAPAHIALFP